MSPLHTPKIPQSSTLAGRTLPFSAGLPASLVECPRDAMQGWPHIIPTEEKIRYLNSLLKVGFDTLDFGSFVSPKAIPQMADTRDVLSGLQLSGSATKLLAIVANFRGAREAADFDEITYLGFPFSVSETFQLRNTNKTIEGSLATVEEMQELCVKREKQLVVYISMGFGNPYGDPWSEEIVFQWVDSLTLLGIKIISLADTVGLATPEQVFSVTDYLTLQLPDHIIGVHLHSTHHGRKAKIDAALQAGCRRFDGALKGIGGCPMAGDELVGNMDSEWMIDYFRKLSHSDYPNLLGNLDTAALQESRRIADEIFI
ncbi:MAG TPA: hydroxymethylglutaryl-CoA lyase [Puia sp.]|jgi:hydroxymethylglutaryl-CoA lyase|nr:hydroxymethylglutaryl-CoA lyase [Puia sp.]